VTYFMHRYASRFGKVLDTVPAHIMAVLRAYSWPGNVRELQHVVERAVILSQGPQLEVGHWFNAAASPHDPSRLGTLEEVERAHMLAALAHTGRRVSGAQGAAELLGLKSTTLESRMQKLGIKRPS
jgi:formate hydrogenlyase transcriptional activator